MISINRSVGIFPDREKINIEEDEVSISYAIEVLKRLIEDDTIVNLFEKILKQGSNYE